VIDDNSAALHDAITGISAFAGVLSRNSERIDGILAGLERFAGGGKAKPGIYNLTALTASGVCDTPTREQLVMPEPAAPMAFNSDRVVIVGDPPEDNPFEKAQFTDNIPSVVQSKVIESLEHSGCFGAVTRPLDTLEQSDQLQAEIRQFAIVLKPEPKADVEIAVKLVSAGGKIEGSRVFHESSPRSWPRPCRGSASCRRPRSPPRTTTHTSPAPTTTSPSRRLPEPGAPLYFRRWSGQRYAETFRDAGLRSPKSVIPAKAAIQTRARLSQTSPAGKERCKGRRRSEPVAAHVHLEVPRRVGDQRQHDGERDRHHHHHGERHRQPEQKREPDQRREGEHEIPDSRREPAPPALELGRLGVAVDDDHRLFALRFHGTSRPHRTLYRARERRLRALRSPLFRAGF
jgi:ABC-type uncharacterized transport system auxiliary subunit